MQSRSLSAYGVLCGVGVGVCLRGRGDWPALTPSGPILRPTPHSLSRRPDCAPIVHISDPLTNSLSLAFLCFLPSLATLLGITSGALGSGSAVGEPTLDRRYKQSVE